MARKKQQSAKRDRCDICGTGLDERAIVQEFPDGSLAKLCQDCAEAATLSDEGVQDDYGTEEATREWENPVDELSAKVHAPPDEPPRKRKRAKASADGAELDSARFEPEVFDPELLEFGQAASIDMAAGLDPQDHATKAEAELAAWASAQPSDPYAGYKGEDDYGSAGDHDSETGQQLAHEEEAELAAAIADADLADTDRVAGVGAVAQVEEEYAGVELPQSPGDDQAEIDADATIESEAIRAEEAAPDSPAAAVPADEEAEPQPPEVATAAVTPPPLPTPQAAAEAQSADVEAKVEAQSAEIEAESDAEVEADTDAEVEADTDAEAEADTDAEAAPQTTELETLDKTKELLMPVSDLITLQSEMQSALARLSSTLEHFVTEMVTSEDKTAVITERLHQLEEELEATRERLRDTEALLPESERPEPKAIDSTEEPEPSAESVAESEPEASGSTTPPPLPPPPATPQPKAGDSQAAAVPPPLPGSQGPQEGAAPPPLPGAKAADAGGTGSPPPLPGAKASGSAASAVVGAALSAAAAAGAAVAPAAAAAAAPPAIPVPEVESPAPAPSGAAAAVQRFLRGRKSQEDTPPESEEPAPAPLESPGLGFQINEVQAAQRYFNESAFVKKIRDINRSIGKPQANLSRLAEGEPQAVVTVFWNIVWYQYLVDLRKELPAGSERVALDLEGMDLEELEPRFREKNATVNDDGRLDASELEVGLLSDPSSLITDSDAVPEATAMQEDATEEIWDQQSAPEFRWD